MIQDIRYVNLTGNHMKIGVDGPRLEDRVADNLAKFDLTESESLLIGSNFGIGTDIKTGPNGQLCEQRGVRQLQGPGVRQVCDGVQPRRAKHANDEPGIQL
jgi:hypothetical protein